MDITFSRVIWFLQEVYNSIMPFYTGVLEVLYKSPSDYLPKWILDFISSLDKDGNFTWFLDTSLLSLIFGSAIGFVFFYTLFKWLIDILK